MYSSLHKIDLAGKNASGLIYVQTDHRTRDEVESEPELSTLFALARIGCAKAYAAKEGAGTVIYACMADDVAPLLEEVIAATGATLQRGVGEEAALAPVSATPNQLLDRAFRGLATRCLQRSNTTDPAIALSTVEAETLADVPDREDDEITYWTRTLELAALTGEVIRARHGGTWELLADMQRAEVPFGFVLGDGNMLLPTNRAGRFIDDGPAESMFHMIDSANEPRERENLPVLPSLRPRGEVVAQGIAFRPLLSDKAGDDVPVIAYGSDSPTQFGMIAAKNGDDLEALHAKAMANLATQAVDIEQIDAGGTSLLVVTNSFFATEKLLDAAFMRGLHKRLRAEMLAVGVPRRGLMFVMDAVGGDPQRAMSILTSLVQKESGTSRSISRAILLVQDGSVVGRAKLEGDATPPEPPPTKRPGFFARLFGGGKSKA